MESFNDITPIWGDPTNFSQLPDDDFLVLLQKQFPNNNMGFDSVNPQSLSGYPLPGVSPPSDDSSPSPPSTENGKRSRSQDGDDDDSPGGDPLLKRKASMDDDYEEGHSHKSQHTVGNKKGSTKRKGGASPEESRLMKRKEQNRAAQRAFRERKEKHVKDLEDKVAALEAKNDVTSTENENLRDLLTRLQNENMSLKQQASGIQQSSFTFTVPPPSSSGAPANPNFSLGPYTSDANMFSSLPRTTYSAPSLSSPSTTNPLDWSSLTSFDPSMLNMLDEPPQKTATDDAMQMNLGYEDGGHFTSNFKIIANNPAFLSLASAFDSNSPVNPTPPANPEPSAFNFDLSSLSPWTSQDSGLGNGTLDDLFGPGFLSGSQPMDMTPFMPTPSISPIVHHQNHINMPRNSSGTSSSTSSPASNGSGPSLFSVARESSSSDSDVDGENNKGGCPKTRGDFQKHVDEEGASPFTSSMSSGSTPNLTRKSPNATMMPSVSCVGSSGFPPTKASESNIEVLKAWKKITSDPNFKDIDINELCSEFSSKARCDGSKVVLEPSGVNHILESLQHHNGGNKNSRDMAM